jgi:hypothetical protein
VQLKRIYLKFEIGALNEAKWCVWPPSASPKRWWQG